MVSEEGDDTFIWVVQRKDTNQMATMGGFVDVGESVEQAVHRELKEEMGIVLEQGSGSEQLKLQGVYSDPRRDNRRRNASVVFVVKLAHTIHPKAADDAKAVKKIHVDEIEQYDFFADHKTILLDFRHSLKTSNHGLATTNSIGSGLTGEQLQSAQSAVAMERSICM
ncbi:NUDIX domain [Seminavis robusta]|uniref:NUDIX domain n=1 Tax=Seminavis robusta TaxID=568900 RepID=A0A9N8E4A0_9STRA|nr:NUDIX domain [Seminavis robusta]|eukprot:Sro487_g152730.1 NUDIX domain (167) ;mRNA; f:1528-2028